MLGAATAPVTLTPFRHKVEENNHLLVGDREDMRTRSGPESSTLSRRKVQLEEEKRT